jgi:UDP-N-acetylmuramoylalanine--D-glutamate ligase
MTPVTSFKDRNVALFGLGGSGLATAHALVAGGAKVVAWDDGEQARDNARAAGVSVIDLRAADWRAFSSLVLAPGVPLTHPEPHWTVKRAREAEIEVIGDIELFCRERAKIASRAPFIAITGTNGKSTTTALTAHILKSAGLDVQMGGNIGVPILELAAPDEDRIHVVECSSFQIDLTPSLNPSTGVLINITPDHLDRHGDMTRYAAIKSRVASGAGVALVGVDDANSAAIADRIEGAVKRTRIIRVSVEHELNAGVFIADGRVVLRAHGEDEILADLNGVTTLRGAHNAQNAAFACAVARLEDLSPGQIQRGAASFPGLTHRMEPVGRLGKVLFVNDSKATNADAAEKALRSFNDIFWIVGGKAKDGGIEPLRALFPRVKKAYLIGAASDQFAATLGDAVPFERCGALDVATRAAARDAAASAAAGPVVLLSPACASYDQFANFEQRGDAFRTLANQLIAAGATESAHA